MEAKRYDGLDILKAICAFFVVCIHVTFQGELGTGVASLARFAVPVFFMITGFFYDKTVSNNKEKHQLKKILILLIVSNVLYYLLMGFKAVSEGSFSKYAAETFTLKSLFEFLVFNKTLSYGHLWYFGAILYVLLIFFVLRKFVPQWEKAAYIITPILLVCNFVLGGYSFLKENEYDANIVVRNFLLTGFPCFTIGMFLKKYEKKTEFIKNSNILSVLLIAVFIATVFLEKMILTRLNATPNREVYISSILLAAVLVIVFSKESWNGGRLKIAKTIGRKYSSLIYIFHPIFISFVGNAALKLNLKSLYLPIAPIAIFAATTVFAACYCFAKEKLKARINKKRS